MEKGEYVRKTERRVPGNIESRLRGRSGERRVQGEREKRVLIKTGRRVRRKYKREYGGVGERRAWRKKRKERTGEEKGEYGGKEKGEYQKNRQQITG